MNRGITVSADQLPQGFLITGASPAPVKPSRIVEMTGPFSVIIAPYSAHKAKGKPEPPATSPIRPKRT